MPVIFLAARSLQVNVDPTESPVIVKLKMPNDLFANESDVSH